MVVWLAEDGTGIIRKIVYDSSINQFVDIALPLNGKGMPITFSFTVESGEEINTYMKMAMSTIAYFVMAQPIKKGVPPFVLQVFGSINNFKSRDVLRWYKQTKIKKKYKSIK